MGWNLRMANKLCICTIVHELVAERGNLWRLAHAIVRGSERTRVYHDQYAWSWRQYMHACIRVCVRLCVRLQLRMQVDPLVTIAS